MVATIVKTRYVSLTRWPGICIAGPVFADLSPQTPMSAPLITDHSTARYSCFSSVIFAAIFMNGVSRSIGTGNMVVELCSEATSLSVCR